MGDENWIFPIRHRGGAFLWFRTGNCVNCLHWLSDLGEFCLKTRGTMAKSEKNFLLRRRGWIPDTHMQCDDCLLSSILGVTTQHALKSERVNDEKLLCDGQKEEWGEMEILQKQSPIWLVNVAMATLSRRVEGLMRLKQRGTEFALFSAGFEISLLWL